MELTAARRRARPARGQRRIPGLTPAFIDGEAIDGRYALLQLRQPDGTVCTLEAPRGRSLSTDECLSFLFRARGSFLCGYALGYDISNWLADLSLAQIHTLRDFTAVFARPWLIVWIPDRMLRVTDLRLVRRKREGEEELVTTRAVFDIFPFFQSSFVRALEDWDALADDPALLTLIRWGKQLRGERFTREVAAQIRRYNEAELQAMAKLWEALRQTLDRRDLRPRSWTGPGAVARLMLDRHGERARRGTWLLPHEVPRDLSGIPPHRMDPRWVAQAACYGGRFECSWTGPIEEAHEYDLRSAYPAAIVAGLPCFCTGHWQYRPARQATRAGPWTIWEVEWTPRPEIDSDALMWGPFPLRTGEGHLCYPIEGAGWFHREEVEAARRALGDRYIFRLRGGWEWVQECSCRPLSWVAALLAERVSLKEVDPAQARVLKLVLNSLYGVVADRAGSAPRPDPAGYEGVPDFALDVREPPYYNPFWAGLITARTRARLLEVIGLAGEDVLYLATDGVHVRRPLPQLLARVPTTDGSAATAGGAGSWEEAGGGRAIFLGAGVYAYARRGAGRHRGIPLEEDYDSLCALHAAARSSTDGTPPTCHYRRPRFVGCFYAAHRAGGDPLRYRALVNTWEEAEYRIILDLAPRRRLRVADGRWIAPTAREIGQLMLLNMMPASEDELRAGDAVELTAPGR